MFDLLIAKKQIVISILDDYIKTSSGGDPEPSKRLDTNISDVYHTQVNIKVKRNTDGT